MAGTWQAVTSRSRRAGATSDRARPSCPARAESVERPRTASETAALGEAAPTLGDTTFEVYLNDRAYWRNVPAAVWHYKLGGYQVLKKWLSYRQHKVLDRPLHPEEVHHFTDTARRIAAILQLVNDD